MVVRSNFTLLALMSITLLIGGCSGTKLYKDVSTHNMEVNSKTDSVDATLDIYSVSAQCESDYLGTVALDRSSIELGIAIEEPSYLIVGFASSSFWSSSSGFTSYDFTLLPRKAFRYEVDVSYIDDIYNVTVYEVSQLTGKQREMEEAELRNCQT